MATKIFVNLPVKDLNKSIEFFTRLGFTFNPQFTSEEATCMIIGENIFAMLLIEKRFKDFTKKEIADATKTTEVLIAIDAESREKVMELVATRREKVDDDRREIGAIDGAARSAHPKRRANGTGEQRT